MNVTCKPEPRTYGNRIGWNDMNKETWKGSAVEGWAVRFGVDPPAKGPKWIPEEMTKEEKMTRMNTEECPEIGIIQKEANWQGNDNIQSYTERKAKSTHSLESTNLQI